MKTNEVHNLRMEKLENIGKFIQKVLRWLILILILVFMLTTFAPGVFHRVAG
jgi:hypothetical protein